MRHSSSARDLGDLEVYSATRGLEGRELAELGLMQAAGACAVATGRRWIADSGVMYRLLAYAAALDLVVIAHAEDSGLAGNAVATDGEVATFLGLASAPPIAEAMAVARDLALAEEAGARIHFRQLSTAAAFDLIRAAKARGVRVTCGVTPGHLLLSDFAIGPAPRPCGTSANGRRRSRRLPTARSTFSARVMIRKAPRPSACPSLMPPPAWRVRRRC